MKNNDFATGCIVMYIRPNEVKVRFKLNAAGSHEGHEIEALLFDSRSGKMLGQTKDFQYFPSCGDLRGDMLLTAEMRLGHYDVLLLKDGKIAGVYDCHHKKFDEKGTLAKRVEMSLNHVDWLMRRDTTPLSDQEVMRDELAEAMADLDKLVGLDDLKAQMRRIFYSVFFNRQRKEMGLPTVGNGLCHCIFSGNPGTGKTTVARILGSMLYKMGVLSNGEVICHDRRSLMGQYIGETENKFSEVLEKAHGNVLFIDEAYSLFTGHNDSKDFGRHVIEALLTAVTDPKCDMVVVLAGYKDEMKQMVESNPGLSSRFPYQFTFDDYDTLQLQEIANRLLASYNLVLTPEARLEMGRVLCQVVGGRDKFFGNGRWVTTFVEQHLVQAMAERMMASSGFLTRDMLCMVQAADVMQAAKSDSYLQSHRTEKVSRRIGFVA